MAAGHVRGFGGAHVFVTLGAVLFVGGAVGGVFGALLRAGELGFQLQLERREDGLLVDVRHGGLA